MKLPKIQENLLVQDLDNEVLIYDLSTNKSFCLNETAKTVFNACNGAMTFEDLKGRYRYTDDLIHFALEELMANGLIESYTDVHFSGMNRRDVIKKVGLGTMVALPLVAGIIAPKAVHAASGIAQLGETCNNNCAAPLQCTAQFGQGNVCRAPAGQTCSFSRPDLCTSGCCTSTANGPVCCSS